MATFLVFLCLISCSKNSAPAGILSEDQLINVLLDIHMAEGYVTTFPIHYDSSRMLYPLLEKEVFAKHQVQDSVFKVSLEYYIRDAKQMDRIYARIIDSLSIKEKVGNQ
ncbi:DUF4296 domain-containing protein [Mongoliitalea daihaiensis]|nr:DUF4296 domain-containing protein [Mongoliitalea daihaiensis]